MRGFYYYLIGIALLIISFFLDNTVSGFFLNNRLGFLDGIAIFIHSVEGYVLFLFVFVILLLFKQKKRILPLLLAIILYFGVTGLIKIIIARPRPFTKFDFPDLGETGASANRSFPSGHVTAAASVIRFFEFNRMLLWIWAAITVLVMFSRVYLGMHYLSDVVAGFILGYFTSDFSIFLAEKLKR